MIPKHPASEGWAAVFHGTFTVVYVLVGTLAAVGTWFHLVSARRHLDDWRNGL